MRILALDTGTTTGWAILHPDKHVASGTWGFKPAADENAGVRIYRFFHELQDIHRATPIDLLAFEQPNGHSGTAAAHLYGEFLGIIHLFCEEHEIQYEPISVQHIKQFATGRGNATKDEMIAAAQQRFPGLIIEDDNHADALHLLTLAADRFG